MFLRLFSLCSLFSALAFGEEEELHFHFPGQDEGNQKTIPNQLNMLINATHHHENVDMALFSIVEQCMLNMEPYCGDDFRQLKYRMHMLYHNNMLNKPEKLILKVLQCLSNNTDQIYESCENAIKNPWDTINMAIAMDEPKLSSRRSVLHTILMSYIIIVFILVLLWGTKRLYGRQLREVLVNSSYVPNKLREIFQADEEKVHLIVTNA